MEQKCLFCAIVNKEVPAKIVHEDENCVAILDIAPRSTGMTLVIPRRHVKDFDKHGELSKRVFSSALTVAEKIRQALQPNDISMAIIPSELQHFHIRLYPVYENEVPLIENQARKVTEEELDSVAEKIKSVTIERKERPKEVKKGKRTKEDTFWIKRAMELT